MKTLLHNWNCADCGGWVTEKCCSRVLLETSSQQQQTKRATWCAAAHELVQQLGFQAEGLLQPIDH